MSVAIRTTLRGVNFLTFSFRGSMLFPSESTYHCSFAR